MSMLGLKTSLLPHQADAVAKVLPSRIGSLFMAMGTGKSRTAIELVARRLGRIDRVLWFCPVGLKETVRQEILKHTDCQSSDIHVFNGRTSAQNLPRVLWHVVGIESMSNSTRVTLAVNKLITTRTFVILDESSYIKGHSAIRTLRITKLAEKARYRLILTGTPLSQGVVDLFAQMRFLSPKILGYNSFYSFAANHLEYSEKYPGMIVRAHNVPYLAAKIAPYTYQVTKEECLTLPDKLYEYRYFRMTSEQRYCYGLAKDEAITQLADDDIDSIAIFRMFSHLQQIVCGYWNRRIKRGMFEKLEFLHYRIETLNSVLADIPVGEKVIIWCKYHYDIKQIGPKLERLFGVGSVAYFHGGLSERKRVEQVERFRGDARFFLATQSAGGHGLTLNEAHYVVFYNNGFKYSERLQAEDRCHRIGQQHKVTYIDIECVDSIDERIATALANKGDVVQAFKAEVDQVKDKKGALRELIKSL
jgi:SNF2 family DNA or RNA helicase